MKVASIKIYHERGVVLFIALIALVVMSLAAVALIRSVDTNTMIAGNLAFKQSAVVSSDRGVETALGWIEAKVIANLADLNSDSVADAYYATYLAPNLDNPAVLKADATWAAAAVATGPDITAGTENLGNNIRYIVQRMCRNAVPPVVEECLFGDTEIGGGSKKVKTGNKAGAKINIVQSPMYRVTVRVTGPKNTVSYTQTFVY